MQVLKKIAFSILKKPSLYLFVFLIMFSVDRSNRWFEYNSGKFPFVYDVDQYYSYLPATFIHHDLSFSFPNSYWTNNIGNGNKVPMATIGMAVMYSPFFLTGHLIAKNNGYPTDGYSIPYKWCIHIGSILFSLLGLWFCRKGLLMFFDEVVTLVSLICVFFGTNLFYYTYGYGEMPHSYLFFIFSVFIFLVLKWNSTKQLKYLLAFSFTAGFATLIRPTECVILLFPLLLNVKSLEDLKQRFKELFNYKFKLIFAGVLFVFPFFVQMIYWKVYAGQWLYFSYGDSGRFYFSDPQIFNFLFSYRKGWFVYTPMMFFAIIGIVFLRNKEKTVFLFTVLFLIINVYILSSWWDWPFGGSFGCRALIQHYAFFIFPFAAFVSVVFNLFKSNWILNATIRTFVSILFYFLIILNYNQSWQYKYGLIHYNGMTKDAYWFLFQKNELSPSELIELNKKMKPADQNAMFNGKRDQ